MINNHQGWLNGKYVLTGEDVLLPLGLLTQTLSKNQNTIYIKILEGKNYGKVIALKDEPNTDINNFLNNNEHTKRIKIMLSLSTKKIWIVENNKPLDVLTMHLKIGRYFLSIPDYPHSTSACYCQPSPTWSHATFATTWYKVHPVIFNNNSMPNTYLHFGTKSEGCISVNAKINNAGAKWDNLVIALSKSRITKGITAELEITQ